MTITIRESGIPRLRRTAWIEGDGNRLLGLGGWLRGLGQVGSYQFDAWQLQNWLITGAGVCRACATVRLTGNYAIDDLFALMEIAGRWDETFTVAESEGSQTVTINPGSKPGISKEVTLAAWAEFLALVSGGMKRPQAEPPPAAPPPVVLAPPPPAQILIPADAESVISGSVAILLKATGFYAGSLDRPFKEITWAQIKSPWGAWAKARGIMYKFFTDPDEPADEPNTRRLMSPGSAYDRLYQEAERFPEQLKAARIEAGVEIAEPGAVAPPPVAVRKSPWPAIIAGGIVVGGIWALWKGRRS